MNRLFEDFFRDRFPSTIVSDEFLTPSINVVEQDQQYEITAELPGVEEDDVEISVINNELFNLTLQNNHQHGVKHQRGYQHHYPQRKYQFAKVINLVI